MPSRFELRFAVRHEPCASQRLTALGLLTCSVLSSAYVGCSEPSSGEDGALDEARAPVAAQSATTSAAPAAPTTCDGRPLPPKAYAKRPPFSVGPAAGGLPEYWPTKAWQSRAPAELGFDPDKLTQALAFKTQYTNTTGLMVIRHGYVAVEQYVAPVNAATMHESYSMAKSFTSGLVGIAIGDGKLASTDEKICKYYPDRWNCNDPSDGRSKVTVQHAMNLTTGVAWQEDWHSRSAGKVNDAFAANLLEKVLSRQVTQEPGSAMRYSTGDPSLLSGVLQKSTGMTALAYAKQKVFDVIGTPGIRWNQDPQGRTTTYAGLQATVRDYAKYGYLYLRRGEWDGKQVIPAEWIDRTTRAEKPCSDWNRNLWHQNLPIRLGHQDPSCPSMFCPPAQFADLPADGFFAEGVYGQFIFIVPSADLVIVRVARDAQGAERWDDYARGMLGAVLASIVK
jgi:CubicO group peptidase (beta-lactamase class C family)